MVGIDLVSVEEFSRQLDLGGEAFLTRAFRPAELARRDATHLAGLWAMKEAVVKAASTPIATLTDIVIVHDESGRPHATVGERRYEVSVAHHGEYAVAIAIEVRT